MRTGLIKSNTNLKKSIFYSKLQYRIFVFQQCSQCLLKTSFRLTNYKAIPYKTVHQAEPLRENYRHLFS